MYKIIGADQKEYGPITADQLRQWIFEGRINAHTKVQAEGSAIWKTVGELPEFSTALPGVAVPPAVGAPAAIAMTPAAPKTSRLAVWSMVTGIFSMLCFCIPFIGLLPVILGAVALSQLKREPQRQGSGFAITGIVLGILSLLIYVAIIIVYLTIPGFFNNLRSSFPVPQ